MLCCPCPRFYLTCRLKEGVSNKKHKTAQLYRDGKRVLECLQRALRVADSCMETATSIELFVEILDRYVYYFDQRNESVSCVRTRPSAACPTARHGRETRITDKQTRVPTEKVTTKYLNGLIELIHSNFAGSQQDSASVEACRKHFQHTLDLIRSKEYEGVVLSPK